MCMVYVRNAVLNHFTEVEQLQAGSQFAVRNPRWYIKYSEISIATFEKEKKMEKSVSDVVHVNDVKETNDWN